MRTVVVVILAVLMQALLAAGGATVGGYLGFNLVLPTGPDCGLAIIPALVFGAGLGGAIGLGVGLTAGAPFRKVIKARIQPHSFAPPS